MTERTSIEWADSTFNPWIGCTKIGPGCDHCYAEATMDTRRHVAEWGAGKPRKRTSTANWTLPLHWNLKSFYQCLGCGWRGALSKAPGSPCGCLGQVEYRVVRRRVFCASLADVFDNDVDPAWRADLFALIRDTPNLDWLLLTKRIGNVRGMLDAVIKHFSSDIMEWGQVVWGNVWIGATVVNQAEADRDIPKLLAVPAAKRFLSIEPLLGPINLRWVLTEATGKMRGSIKDGTRQLQLRALDTLPDWIIVGGESGARARPMHPEWARSLRDQAAQFKIPFLFKQWGEWLPGGTDFDGKHHTWEPDDEHRPPGLEYTRVSVKTDGDIEFGKVGKKNAGRTLDGITHDGVPA